MSRRRAGAVFVLLLFSASAFVVVGWSPPPARAAPSGTSANSLSDDFTHDTALNTNLWESNGAVGSLFAADNCPSCTVIPLNPAFSSMGMKIYQANASSEVGAIQSVQAFSPPFTIDAVVQGTVSNGHPFVFGITSADATSGVQITANLNSRDCSNETNCGNSHTCGNPATPSIPSNQCYYGIYARTASGSGSWTKTPELNETPSLGAEYTLQFAVDGSGDAQYTVSEAGQVLGQSTDQIGTGPFYVILAQSEGAPVPGPGPNVAYWSSVSLTPSSSFTGSSPSGSSSSGFSWVDWLLIVVIAVVALLLLVVVRRRRERRRTVAVVGSGGAVPVAGARVSASGPPTEAVTPSLTPTTGVVPPGPSGPAPTVAPPPPAAPAPEAAGLEEEEGFGGERIRQIIRTFQAKGALSPETAMTAEELGLSRIFVRIMRRRRGKTKVFIEVNGKYYLDQQALREMK
ncbi:MAG TPA: hypothetical protein VEH28_08560 [Thermoplasmata archaeon]|nr:hypothetical protein [Thermoplasmata archaeon]